MSDSVNRGVELSDGLPLCSKRLPARRERRLRSVKYWWFLFIWAAQTRGPYGFLPRWNYYGHKGASSSPLSILLSLKTSARLFLWVDEHVLQLFDTLQERLMIQNTVINGLITVIPVTGSHWKSFLHTMYLCWKIFFCENLKHFILIVLFKKLLLWLLITLNWLWCSV